MLTQATGASVRAGLVAVLVSTPSLILANTSPDAAQVTALVALFAAALTLIEYSSRYPSLVEFRDAPPFNRIRFLALFFTVFTISVMARNTEDPSGLTMFIEAIGFVIGYALDFPYSPVRLVLLSMPADLPLDQLAELRNAAGLAYLIALVALSFFYLILRMHNWPSRSGAFNVWINLPTFDPTAGGDVVDRLNRDARINVALGFLLPFLIPAVAKAATGLFGPILIDSSQTMIWMVAAWAFLPLSLFMRGIAMGRVAMMIQDARRRTTAPSHVSPVAA